MSVPSPAPVSVVASLLRVSALPLPAGAPPPEGHAAVVADRVTLSAASPGADALWEMAAAGLRSLGALVPALARAAADPAASPEDQGHLAQALAMAAHQAGTGFGAVLHSADPARPGSAVLEEWRGHATQTLDHAADALTQAEQLMAAGPARLGVPWALGQIVAARREVGTAQAHLRDGCLLSPPPLPTGSGGLGGLVARLLALLLAALSAVATLVWIEAGELLVLAVALGTWGVWVRRVAVPRRRLRLGHPHRDHRA